MGPRDFRSTQSSSDWSHLDSNKSSFLLRFCLHKTQFVCHPALLFLALTSAPCSSSSSTAADWPAWAAVFSGVSPRSSRIFGGVLLSSRKNLTNVNRTKHASKLEDRCFSGRLLVYCFDSLAFGSKVPTKAIANTCYIQRCRVHHDATEQPLCRNLSVHIFAIVQVWPLRQAGD